MTGDYWRVRRPTAADVVCAWAFAAATIALVMLLN